MAGKAVRGRGTLRSPGGAGEVRIGRVVSEKVRLGHALGRFEFDAREKRLFLEGRAVPLPLRELELLALFIAHPAEWIEDSKLERELWPKAMPPTGELDRLLRDLTAALDEGADGVATIQSLKGRGRRLLIPVRAIGESGAAGSGAASGARAAPRAAGSSGPVAAPAAGGGETPVSPPRPAVPGRRSAHRTLIAPRHLAVGLLAGLALVVVVAAFYWAVRAVSGGSAQRAAGSAAQASAAQLRSAAAAEMAKGVAAAAGYDLASRRAAITHFEAALQLDPGPRNQAAAHGALANVLVLEGEMERARREAQAALASSIALGYEAKLAEPLAALAFTQLFAGRDAVAARTSAERVLALDALHVGGRRALVWAHVVEGRFAAALAELEPLRPPGSFDPEVATDEGWILYFSGRSIEARGLLTAVVRQEPLFRRAHAALAAMHLSERRLAAAAVELELLDILEAGATRDDERVRLLANGDWMMPDASEAARLLEERAAAPDRLPGATVGAATGAARIYAQFGESELAMAALERALGRRESDSVLARIDPAFAPLRASSAFRRMLDAAGVPALVPVKPAS